jgi:hypothetical protein
MVPVHAVVPEDTPAQPAPPPVGAGHPHVRVWNIEPAPHWLLHAELEMAHHPPSVPGKGVGGGVGGGVGQASLHPSSYVDGPVQAPPQ